MPCCPRWPAPRPFSALAVRRTGVILTSPPTVSLAYALTGPRACAAATYKPPTAWGWTHWLIMIDFSATGAEPSAVAAQSDTRYQLSRSETSVGTPTSNQGEAHDKPPEADTRRARQCHARYQPP